MDERDAPCQNAVIWQVTPQGSRNGDSSGYLKQAYLQSPIGAGFQQQIARARTLTRAGGLRKAARAAVAASMLLAGRGQAGLS